jgi:hypothetical protein
VTPNLGYPIGMPEILTFGREKYLGRLLSY